jgi:hypothetical protein
MPYRYVVANNGSRFLVSAMNDSPILDIGFIPDPDAVNIAPDNRIKPDTAVITQRYLSHNGGVRSYKAVFAYLRMNIFNR